jgi:hypothetical protein
MTHPICNFDTHLADKRVRLIKMEDTQAPPPNTMGTIKFIDGIGQIHVQWDNGSTLALQPENDQYQILD